MSDVLRRSPVQRHLNILNCLLFVSVLLGVFAAYEISKGARLNELNYGHFKATYAFADSVRATDLTEAADVVKLRARLREIRRHSEVCLSETNTLERWGAELIGVAAAFDLCQRDIDLADRTAAALSDFDRAQASIDQTSQVILQAAALFQEHARAIDSPVARAVSALLTFSIAVIVLKALFVLVFGLWSTRRIARHYADVAGFEAALSEKSAQLSETLHLLRARNDEVDAARREVEHRASHDMLTGLPNRRAFDQALRRKRAAAAAVGVLHIDLDRFKVINDTLGPGAGDHVLKHTAKVLLSLARDDDFVARIGGDEFLILCAVDDGLDVVSALAERIVCELRKPAPYKDDLCRMTASVGVAVRESLKADADTLLVDAHLALAEAKEQGGNRHRVFEAALQAAMLDVKRIGDEILDGLENDAFVPVFQPQFCAHTHALFGLESLARWRRRPNVLLTPASFLPIAEKLHLVSEIDRQIFARAHAAVRGLVADGVAVPRFSVNVSASRLRDPQLVEALSAVAGDACPMAVEILESVFLDEIDPEIATAVSALREYGVEIEVDDFGSGHASIVGLMRLQPSRFKIDGRLVQPITQSPCALDLVRSIVDIGRALEIEVIAEGVETMAHAEMLRDLGCHALQGYAFARPMLEADLRAFLRDHSMRAAA